MIPDVWPALWLALAVFRLVRLCGWDDITATPRAWITGVTDAEYNEWARFIWELQQSGRDPWGEPSGITGPHSDTNERPPVGRLRFKFAQLVRCPWCVSFWIGVAVYAAWRADHGVTMTCAAPLALSAVAGLVSKHLDR